MQSINVLIPDHKLVFFLELMDSLGFVKLEGQEALYNILSKEQMQMVEEERQKIKNNPEYLLDWKEVQKSIKLD